MDLAEGHIRNAGYGGFSFRDLAAAVGIKSASVHHHFPTKATMATAVVRRYGDRFFAAVAPLPDETPADAVATYRSAFRAALERDGLMCLCGVLGAEAGVLSGDVAEAIRSFFRRCIEDLSARIGGPGATAKAFHVMATLEGGMMLARAYGSIEAFDQATMCPVQSPLDARVTRDRRTCSAIVCGVRVEQSARSGTLALPSGASD
jgi:TetR/AcrR family transcriptional repressor of nem operon